MSYIPRKKRFSPSKSVLATSESQPTQQLPPKLPPRQLPSTPRSHSHSPQQQQLSRPDNPWSELCPTFRRRGVLPFTSPSPFPRYSYILSITAAGELLFFGGYAHRSLHTDLYVFSTRDHSATLLQTSGEAPGPRFKPAAVLINSVLLIWGGVTKFDDQGEPKGPYDDSLYLLSLVSQVWTRVVVNGPRPVGRCGHAMTMVGSKLFVFGGETDTGYLNDMWAFDLDSLKSIPVWDSYEPAPGDEKPPPRTGHVLVSTGDRIILFGGTNDQCVYNDTWSFDVSTRKWTELQCTGSIPPSRHSHAAALVDDVMYVFGGRDDIRVLGDLIAFKVSTQQWLTFQKKGSSPSPSGRSGHAMVSNGSRVFVLGGKLAAGAQADETPRIHVLETKHIENPKPDPNAVKLSEKTTQSALQSSAGPSTRQQPEYPASFASSSSDAYSTPSTSRFQNSTLDGLGHRASPQITRERNPSLNGPPSQPTSVNGKTGRVREQDDGGEGSAEYFLNVSSEGEVARLECERVVELERQLSAILAAQMERDRRLTQLTDELALKSALLERAEANAAEATKRAGLEPGKLADRLLAQTSLVENKDAELVRMQAKLDELVLSRDQHVCALAQAESALRKATSRAAAANGYETELVGVRAELEARKSELEAIRLRLTNAEAGWAKSKTEVDTLRAAGLVSTDEDRIAHRLLERMRAMESEMASLRWSEKSLEALETRNEG